MWTMMHTKGDNACGEPALKAIRKPMPYDPVSSEIIRKIDGSVPERWDPIVCGSCGRSLTGLRSDDFIEDVE